MNSFKVLAKNVKNLSGKKTLILPFLWIFLAICLKFVDVLSFSCSKLGHITVVTFTFGYDYRKAHKCRFQTVWGIQYQLKIIQNYIGARRNVQEMRYIL